MQGLADLKNNLGKHKKKIYSVTLVVLLVFSGLLGAFITFKDTDVSAWTPSTYVYYENFETGDTEASGYDGDAIGAYSATNPNATWYVTGNVYDSYTTDTTHVNITGMSVNWSGSQSLLIYDYTGTNYYEGLIFNFTNETGVETGASIDYINFTFKPVEHSGLECGFHIIFSNGTGATDKNVHLYLREDNNTFEIKYNDTLKNYALGSWVNTSAYNISFHNFNYTAHTFNVSLQQWGGSMNDYGKFYFRYGCSEFKSIAFMGLTSGSPTKATLSFFVDNMEVGSPTQMYNVSGSEYPSINGTAFNASLPTTVSGNHSLTFDNDTGSPCWSNSSGTTNETMNISIIDGNSSVTFINISMFNLSDGSGHYINADKIYFYIYNASAVSWVNKSNFPTNGGNISLDNTDTDIGVTWPISGNQTILCRFKLVIPGGTTEAVYTQTTLCGVYIGG